MKIRLRLYAFLIIVPFLGLCYYFDLGQIDMFQALLEKAGVPWGLVGRALSSALWKLGLSGGAMVFLEKGIPEEASFIGNFMMPSGEGTSGPLPARDESPVPSISSPENVLMEKTSGDGGEASSSAPSSDLLQGVPVYEGVPEGVPVYKGMPIYEGVPVYEEIYGTAAQAFYFPTLLHLPGSISDQKILDKLGK